MLNKEKNPYSQIINPKVNINTINIQILNHPNTFRIDNKKFRKFHKSPSKEKKIMNQHRKDVFSRSKILQQKKLSINEIKYQSTNLTKNNSINSYSPYKTKQNNLHDLKKKIPIESAITFIKFHSRNLSTPYSYQDYIQYRKKLQSNFRLRFYKNKLRNVDSISYTQRNESNQIKSESQHHSNKQIMKRNNTKDLTILEEIDQISQQFIQTQILNFNNESILNNYHNFEQQSEIRNRQLILQTRNFRKRKFFSHQVCQQQNVKQKQQSFLCQKNIEEQEQSSLQILPGSKFLIQNQIAN